MKIVDFFYLAQQLAEGNKTYTDFVDRYLDEHGLKLEDMTVRELKELQPVLMQAFNDWL